ncbi:MAG: hypothetical protein C0621_10120 [Desulfuromonas sp.]|nr:MAG: hypothetical protein C0621_10120 [Desulfuromonas sp.]
MTPIAPSPDNDFTRQIEALDSRDPEAFERRREALLQQLLETFPEDARQRAQQWQFRLDATLARYHHPLARMNKMVELFWEGVHTFKYTLDHPSPLKEKRPSAKVIPLFRRKNND